MFAGNYLVLQKFKYAGFIVDDILIIIFYIQFGVHIDHMKRGNMLHSFPDC